jgi:Suppressor of fused protein (SUFU)
LTYWGEPSRTAHFRMEGKEIDVYKWAVGVNPEGVCLYATVGMSDYVLAGYDLTHRLELFIGLLPEQDAIARPLAMLALSPVIRGTHLAANHTMTFPEPLWPNTDMRGFLVRRAVVEIVPSLVLDALHIEFLQAIPIFPSELAFKTEHGADALLQKWQDAKVPFWDPNRSAHPTR